MLTKRKQFTLILLLLLAFPAVALAAGSEESDSGPSIGQAEAVPIPPLQGPIDRFQRLVERIAHDIEVEEVAARKREREEEFASLPGGVSASTLESIAACESGGNPTAVSSDGTYRGLYQFDYGTWESVGGSGDPAAASPEEQTYRAALLYAQSGSSPWPVCG